MKVSSIQLATVLFISSVFVACGKTGSSNMASIRDQSDLIKDTNGPLGERGSPLDSIADQNLPQPQQIALKNLLIKCAKQPYYMSGSTRVDEGVVQNCPSEISATEFLSDRFTAKVTISLLGSRYSAVVYDAYDSDHGDTVDLAVYDSAGRRVAVQKGIHIYSEPLIALSSLVDVTIPEIEIKKPANK